MKSCQDRHRTIRRRERAVRMVAEVRENYPSEAAAIEVVAAKLGMPRGETLRKWIRRAEIDAGLRLLPVSSGAGGHPEIVADV
jgi:transposase